MVRSALFGSVAVFSLLAQVGPAHAQAVAPGNPAPAPETDAGDAVQDEIVVTGVRAALASAVASKRNATQIVDSIVAEDIGKLPDNSVAEALQRISGIQISRNQGEGSGIAIRGLTQIRTELNGRSIFTAGGDRGVSFEDIPAELLGGVDVYKSPSANLIEGGIGGHVNLKTRRPLDFKGFEISASARANYYDNADEVRPQFSGLISNRWDTGIGEFGVLVAGSYQEGAFRSDNVAVEPFTEFRNALDLNRNGVLGDAADTVIAPQGGGNTYRIGDRRRIGGNAILQWKPTPELEIYAEGSYIDYTFDQDSYSFFPYNNFGALTPVPGTFEVFEGTNNFSRGSFSNVFVDSNSYIDVRESQTWQAAGGARWDSDDVTIKGDVAYTDSRTDSNFSQLAFSTIAPTLAIDLTGDIPGFAVGGIDPTNPANYQFDRINQYLAYNEGSELAAQFDAEFRIDGFMSAFKVGLRYADRKNESANVSNFDTGIRGIPATAFPAAAQLTPFDDFLRRGGSNPGSIPSFLAPPTSLLRDYDQIRAFFGRPLGDPQFTPLSTYNLTETTEALYAMAEFGGNDSRSFLSGNVGVRVIRTGTSVAGLQPVQGGGTAPFSQDASYVSALPSLNLKANLTDTVALRLGASQALTRPSFTALSPAISLDFSFRTGNAGNPALGPLKADQLDASLEWYFKPGSILYAAGFYKAVDGFIQNVTAPDAQFNGFQISRPQNGADGTIQGFEVGTQTFFDFLPSPLDGLGVQANYTFVDSEAPGPIAGQSVALEGLSKHSYNLVGIYEKYGASLRVAYNWRDDFVQTTQGPGSGSQPIFNKGGGQLDATLSYDVSERLTVFADAVNITRTRNDSYFGITDRPRDILVPDRRFGAGVRVRFGQ